jgi:hypothetical protein
MLVRCGVRESGAEFMRRPALVMARNSRGVGAGFIALTLTLALAVVLGACSGTSSGNSWGVGSGSSGAAADVAEPQVATPLATTVESPAGTWATVAMGKLSQPLNTFWQLFFQPAGASQWSNQVEATAVATNGGIVLASSEDGNFVAGVRPSNLLRFSPLILTSDAGHSWSNGVVDEGLTARPDALAVGSSGQALSLVSGTNGAEVLESTGGLTSWRTLVSATGLASDLPGRTCGVRTITAVAYLGATPVVGAGCDRAGTVGVFIWRGGRWKLDGPAPPKGLEGGHAEVLGLSSTSGGVAALVAVTGASGTKLVSDWTTNGSQWTTSSSLPLGAGGQLTSFGPKSGSGFFVLLRSGSGVHHLFVVGPGAAWRPLVSPPPNTATVAFASGGTVDALAVQLGVLTVWTLPPASGSWTRSQVLDVPIRYGSSS